MRALNDGGLRIESISRLDRVVLSDRQEAAPASDRV